MRTVLGSVLFLFAARGLAASESKPDSRIGREVSIPRHLQDDEEFSIPLVDLLNYGKKLFMANLD